MRSLTSAVYALNARVEDIFNQHHPDVLFTFHIKHHASVALKTGNLETSLPRISHQFRYHKDSAASFWKTDMRCILFLISISMLPTSSICMNGCLFLLHHAALAVRMLRFMGGWHTWNQFGDIWQMLFKDTPEEERDLKQVYKVFYDCPFKMYFWWWTAMNLHFLFFSTNMQVCSKKKV